MAMAMKSDILVCSKTHPLLPRSRRSVSVKATAAQTRQRRPENVEGEFFVDRRCIDCDTCRWMAPQTFSPVGPQAAVTKQPSGEEERVKALQFCPGYQQSFLTNTFCLSIPPYKPSVSTPLHAHASPATKDSMAMAMKSDILVCSKTHPLLPRSRRSVSVKATAAQTRQRRPENVEGEFFVDRRCIDCDTCRWMAPQTFSRVGPQAAVTKQPSGEEERVKALQALLSCPTSSIHTMKPAKEILEVQKTFPLPIDETRLPGIYHCGYHSDKSYGATSYLIVHPHGNILVDRYTEVLACSIEMLGGARYMFLTHEDDVADHERWSKRLGCERIIHSGDEEDSTSDVEKQLNGDGPWNIGTDFQLIHTPGHTEGSVCLLYKPLKVLFTGDHLANTRESELSIFEQYNKVSVAMQLNSVMKFLVLDFNWILPGHGRRVEFKDTQEKNSALEAFLASKEVAHA